MSSLFPKVVPIDANERALMRRDPEFVTTRQEWRERWIASGQTCERCDDAASVVLDSLRLCGDCFLLATRIQPRRDRADDVAARSDRAIAPGAGAQAVES